MEKKRCAVFCCRGLGDGIISLILSNNLSKVGYEVVTFHLFLKSLSDWFPGLELRDFPTLEILEQELANYDRIFVFFESGRLADIIQMCQAKFPDKLTVLNPIATNKWDYPYWEQSRFNGRISLADNLQQYCQTMLSIPSATKENGVVVPASFQMKKYPKRVVIHALSSREGKNWSIEKFIALADRLKQEGYDPYFIVSEDERKAFPIQGSMVPGLHSLTELAGFVAESGFMIGNDSGIGHLASSLGIPTVTICRRKNIAAFWRPGWAKGAVVLPPRYLINFRGLRCRDKYWKRFVSVSKVMKAFYQLANSC